MTRSVNLPIQWIIFLPRVGIHVEKNKDAKEGILQFTQISLDFKEPWLTCFGQTQSFFKKIYHTQFYFVFNVYKVKS